MRPITRNDSFGSSFEPILRAWLEPVPLRQEVSAIKLDVTENDKTYFIRAEIPGVTRDQIEVAIDANVVTLSAEIKKSDDETNGAKVLLSERAVGKFARSITLTDDIEADAASAKYIDGILHLTLPKKVSTVSRRLTIQ